MKIQRPKPFDPYFEYRIGERCIYKGMILILTKWRPVCQESAIKYGINPFRCSWCRIGRDVCTGTHLQCDRFSREDRKNTYWKFLRVAKGYSKKEVLQYDLNGDIELIYFAAEKK